MLTGVELNLPHLPGHAAAYLTCRFTLTQSVVCFCLLTAITVILQPRYICTCLPHEPICCAGGAAVLAQTCAAHEEPRSVLLGGSARQ